MKWNVKKVADFNNISIRTLHYYDHIGLLKPSVRRNNGYRLYTDDDLFKLKKILVLKFLGFSLEDIMFLIINGRSFCKENIFILNKQKDVIYKKLSETNKSLKVIDRVINSILNNDSIPSEYIWEDAINNLQRMMDDNYRGDI